MFGTVRCNAKCHFYLNFVLVINLYLVLQEIAGMFSAVGMCEQAVLAFTKVYISRTLSRPFYAGVQTTKSTF